MKGLFRINISLSVLILGREENRSTRKKPRRKTLQAQVRSTTRTLSHETHSPKHGFTLSKRLNRKLGYKFINHSIDSWIKIETLNLGTLSRKKGDNRADKYNKENWTWRPVEGQFGFNDGDQVIVPAGLPQCQDISWRKAKLCGEGSVSTASLCKLMSLSFV